MRKRSFGSSSKAFLRGSFPRKGEVFAYVGSTKKLKDLKAESLFSALSLPNKFIAFQRQ